MTPRVLFTASTRSHIVHFHLPYLAQFQTLGWQVDVACPEPGDIPCTDAVISFPLEKRITSAGNFAAARALRRHLQHTHYDLVITHTALAACFTRLALPRGPHRPRVVNMVHGYLFSAHPTAPRERLLLAAEGWLAGRTELVLTMNRADYDLARRYHLGRRVEAIPGVGVELSRLDGALAQDRAALRAQRGVPQDAFVVVYPAEFSRRKNQGMLLRAMALLPEQVVLALPGEGEEQAHCRALAHELGLDGRVLFPGQVEDMGAWYALSDAAVSASRSEGLPFNVMEAMYAALPIVATGCKGHVDLLVDGVSGLLLPDADDASACAAAIGRLMADRELAGRLGQAAKQAVAPYAIEQVLPQVMEQYLSLVPEVAGAAAGV